MRAVYKYGLRGPSASAARERAASWCSKCWCNKSWLPAHPTDNAHHNDSFAVLLPRACHNVINKPTGHPHPADGVHHKRRRRADGRRHRRRLIARLNLACGVCGMAGKRDVS